MRTSKQILADFTKYKDWYVNECGTKHKATGKLGLTHKNTVKELGKMLQDISNETFNAGDEKANEVMKVMNMLPLLDGLELHLKKQSSSRASKALTEQVINPITASEKGITSGIADLRDNAAYKAKAVKAQQYIQKHWNFNYNPAKLGNYDPRKTRPVKTVTNMWKGSDKVKAEKTEKRADFRYKAEDVKDFALSEGYAQWLEDNVDAAVSANN